jgi:hypothetical protein
MAGIRIRLDLFRSSDHAGAVWVFRTDFAAFADPPVLGAKPSSDRRQAVLGYGGDQRPAGFWLTQNRPLPSARLAQRAGAKTLLELFLIDTDGTGYAGDAIGGNLALPDPEVNRIGGNAVPISDFAYLGIFWKHRHDLVVSSNRAGTVRGQELK